MRDTFGNFLPFRWFAAEFFRNGALPLWNPYSHCGTPFLADPDTQALYPPHLIFTLFSPVWALKISLVFHVFLAAVSMYLLGRHWRLGTGPALLMGISYAFSTHVIAIMEFMGHFNTLAWMPLTIFCASRLVEKARETTFPFSLALVGDTLALAGVLAMQFLAGYVQALQFTLIAAAVFLAARAWSSRDWKFASRAAIGFAVAGFTAFALCLPQFLLTWELLPLSTRSGEIDPGLEIASMHPRHLLTWLVPFFFGRPGYPDTQWADTLFEFWVGTAYVGILPLVTGTFAILSLWDRSGNTKAVPTPERSRRVLVIFALLMLVSGLLLATGKYTPVYKAVFDFIPGMDRLRWPAKSLQLVVFSLSLLGGFGYQSLLERRVHASATRNERFLVGGWLAVTIALFILAIAVRPVLMEWFSSGRFPGDQKRLAEVRVDLWFAAVTLSLSLGSVWLLVTRRLQTLLAPIALPALAFVNLFVVSRQIHFLTGDDIYEKVPATLVAHPPAKELGRVHSHYSTLNQYFYGSRNADLFAWHKAAFIKESSLPLKHFKTFGGGVLNLASYQAVFQLAHELPADKADRLADLLNVRYTISGPPAEKVLWGQTPPSVEWLERPACVPRAHVVGRWECFTEPKDALDRLLDPDFNPREMAVADPSCPVPPGATLKLGRVTSVDYGWNRVHINLEPGDPGLLVWNENWYPGWEARIGGQPAEIHKANILFQGVLLPAGARQVEFLFRPWQIAVAVPISLTVLAATVGFWLAPFARRLWVNRLCQVFRGRSPLLRRPPTPPPE